MNCSCTTEVYGKGENYERGSNHGRTASLIPPTCIPVPLIHADTTSPRGHRRNYCFREQQEQGCSTRKGKPAAEGDHSTGRSSILTNGHSPTVHQLGKQDRAGDSNRFHQQSSHPQAKNKSGPRSDQESEITAQEQAWKQIHLQHSSGQDWVPRPELEWSSWSKKQRLFG